MSNITEAIDRLDIVRAATDGADDSPLAALEARGAVDGLLEAILQETHDCDCPRCDLSHALASAAVINLGLMQVLVHFTGPEAEVLEVALGNLANSVETLVAAYREKD